MSQDVQDEVDRVLDKAAIAGVRPQGPAEAKSIANDIFEELSDLGMTPDQIESAIGGRLPDYVMGRLGKADED